tara:strand:- start:1059 stop:1325 length:267 start_codon:yes stop_codon:yes gene_type:complete
MHYQRCTGHGKTTPIAFIVWYKPPETLIAATSEASGKSMSEILVEVAKWSAFCDVLTQLNSTSWCLGQVITRIKKPLYLSVSTGVYLF